MEVSELISVVEALRQNNEKTKEYVEGVLNDFVPPVTIADNGKFLMVVDGKWWVAAIPRAENETV